MEVTSFLTHISHMPWYKDQMVHRADAPARSPSFGELGQPLPPIIEKALEDQGFQGLYTHQTEAIDALRRGENVIVATNAASGKSLCYHLPVLESVLEDRTNYALYLFPTKALAQDQMRSLGQLTKDMNSLRYATYDGDTPLSERSAIRRSSQIVISNPDMLHLAMLPNQRSWYRFLRGLRYVVVDEAHVYRGVFGSHVANVLRRLRRLCWRLGNKPQFILCSATIFNPGEHAQRLVGQPFKVIEENGSPFGGKDFVFWNPPIIDQEKGTRHSTNSEAALLLAELLKHDIRTIAFVKSRRLAELLYVYVRNQLSETNPDLAKRISPYRASYMPEERRRIEKDLFEGRLLGVTATNALELGIDIGDLDATILAGYPGSVASTWQQAGRSGRRGERSLSVLMAQDNPLDQYLMRHPEIFLDKPHESARISPDNPYVLKPHLLCAAYESPLEEADRQWFGEGISQPLEELSRVGLLKHRGELWHLDPAIAYPAQDVNIRSATPAFYTVVDQDSGVIMETVDEESAFTQLHAGAVYLHQGEPYIITKLDLESRTAYASNTDAPYYTESRDMTDIRILRLIKERQAGNTKVYLGELEITTNVTGFRRKAHFTEKVLGEEAVDLPPHTFRTVGLWFDIPPDTLQGLASRRDDLAGGLHAAEHACIGLLPLFALCDRNDIGGVSTPFHPDTGRPQVFIHDGHPGGVGITERGYDIIEELWQATLEVIHTCPCEGGCPNCIQSPKCGNNNQPLDKNVAALILTDALGKRG